jgi:hypothetical protein
VRDDARWAKLQESGTPREDGSTRSKFESQDHAQQQMAAQMVLTSQALSQYAKDHATLVQ